MGTPKFEIFHTVGISIYVIFETLQIIIPFVRILENKVTLIINENRRSSTTNHDADSLFDIIFRVQFC